MESIYRSLDPARREIRLIEFPPSSFAQDNATVNISCTLHTVSLNDNPEFIALSYVWGDAAAARSEILVNGAPFQATVNLVAALRQAIYHAPRHLLGSPADEDDDDDDDEAGLDLETRAKASINRQLLEQLPDLALRVWSRLRFWADAICINQTDVEEKNHQVPLMRAVYSSALLVVGSLGHGEDDDAEELDVGLETLDSICRAYRRGVILQRRGGGSTESGVVPRYGGDHEWLKLVPQLLDAEDDDTTRGAERWRAFHKVMSRPYFERVWIIQEMVLADAVIIMTDRRSVNMRRHDQAVAQLQHRENDPGYLMTRTRPSFISRAAWVHVDALGKAFNGFAARAGAKHDLRQNEWHVVRLGLLNKATDKRDHVYGVLGILDRLDVTVDYRQHVRQVFASLARACLEQDVISDLSELLDMAGVGLPHHDVDIPSWAPSPGGSGSSYRGSGDSALGVFDVGGGQGGGPTVVDTYPDGNPRFLVKGVRFQPVARQHRLPEPPAASGPPHFSDGLGFLEGVLGQPLANIPGVSNAKILFQTLFPDLAVLSSLDPEAKQDTTDLARRRAIITSIAFDMLKPTTSRNGVVGYKSHRHQAMMDRLFDELGPTADVAYWGGVSRDDLAFASTHRLLEMQMLSLFVTKDGYLGRGPPGLQPGDVVYVLEKSRMPVLLRPKGDYFVHVGVCYVPGLEQGEIADFLKEGKAAVEDLELE